MEDYKILTDYNMQWNRIDRARQRTFFSRGIQSESVTMNLSESNLYLLDDAFLDPKYNYDFRKVKDVQEMKRNGERYTRPCGWFRFALKVKGKYNTGC